MPDDTEAQTDGDTAGATQSHKRPLSATGRLQTGHQRHPGPEAGRGHRKEHKTGRQSPPKVTVAMEMRQSTAELEERGEKNLPPPPKKPKAT